MVIEKKRKLTLLDWDVQPSKKVINTTVKSIEQGIQDHVDSELKNIKNEQKKEELKQTFSDLKEKVKSTISQTPDNVVLEVHTIVSKSEDSEDDSETIKPQSPEFLTKMIQKPHFDPYVLKHPPRKRQEEAFLIIKNGNNVCILVPTGYGKTNVAMFACEECRKSGKIFIVLAPLKALVTEHASDAKFGEYFNIVQISGDYQKNKSKFGDPQIDGFILTFEMFFQMLLVEKYRELIIQRVGLVVFDEAHLVCDKSRGHRLEAIHYLLDYFHPHCKKALLSATVGNGKEFSEHFGCVPVIAEASERPVKLNKSFHPQPKVFSAAQKLQMSQNNIDSVISQYYNQSLDGHGECINFPNILFFVMSREDAPKLANYINTTWGEQGIHAGAHNAGMKPEARHEVEDAYRKKNGEQGKINIVVCTTTLSMGLDMPTDVCVMLGMTFYEYRKSAEKLMDNNQAIQILGRAGRGNGTLPEGYAIMFYPNEHDRNIRDMVNAPLRIQSQIPSHLDYILLCYLVSGIPIEDLESMYRKTFIDNLDMDLYHETLAWLIKSGFVTEDGQPTAIGTKTVWFALEPKTVLHAIELKKIIDKVDTIEYPTLFGLMILNEEFCGNIAVRKNAQYDQVALRNASRFINQNTFQNICADNEYFMDKIDLFFDQMCKGFAMTYAFHLETKFSLEKISVNNNDLYLLRQAAQRMIKGFHIIIGDNWKFGKQFRMLDKSLQSNIPVFDVQYLRLMQIKGLTPKPAYTLDMVSIPTLEKLASLSDSEIKFAAQKIKKLVDSEKNLKAYEKKYVTISEMRLKDWRKDASVVIKTEDKEQSTPLTTDVDLIESGMIDINPMNDDDTEPKEKVDDGSNS